MREILFRAKDIDTKEWRFGQYIHLHKTTHCLREDDNANNDIHQIVFEEMTDWNLPNRHLRADIDVNTLGQFTGLTDKNGKKIFEGDILRFNQATYPITVFWDSLGWKFMRNGKLLKSAFDNDIVRHIEQCEVIGNIYDNPELLN